MTPPPRPGTRRSPRGRRVVPPGKRVKIAAAAVGIAAVVAGVALAVATITASSGTASRTATSRTAAAQPSLPTAAFVVSHARAALARTTSQNFIEYVRESATPGLQIGFRDYGSNQRVARWTYRGQDRDAVYATTGRLLHDLSFVTKERRTTTTVVNHVDKTWWRENLAASSAQPLAASAPKSLCGTSTDLGDLDKIDTNLAKTTRQALSCGRFVVAGIQRVDGVRALKLKRPRSGFVTVVLWIDPATFLPVRSVLIIGPAMIQADLRWLQPTPGNLATLTVPVPAGYHQLPPQ